MTNFTSIDTYFSERVLVCPSLSTYLFLRMLTTQEKMLDIKIQQFSKHQSKEIFKRIFPKRFVMIAAADIHGSGICIKLFPRVFSKFSPSFNGVLTAF